MRSEYMDQARLEQLPTNELDRLLHEELRKEPPDGELIRAIMAVLKVRDKASSPPNSPEVEAAWKKYLAFRREKPMKSVRKHHQVLKVASVVAVLSLFFLAAPQTAKAAGLFDRIASWTDSFFALLSGDSGGRSSGEYEFVTDNPGLQQVYDAVVELGVTQPVVPMWLPEGYELAQCKVFDHNSKPYIWASFSDGDAVAVLQVIIHSEDIGDRYFKDASQVGTYESGGITHNTMRNKNLWVVVWAVDNIECFITIDCREDVLHEILDSIYCGG